MTDPAGTPLCHLGVWRVANIFGSQWVERGGVVLFKICKNPQK